MTKLQLFAGAAALALLAGCNAQVQTNAVTTVGTDDANVVVPDTNVAESNVATAEVDAGPAVNLSTDELTIVMANGSTHHVNFGMAKDEAVPMLTAVLGAPTATGKNDECGAGPLENVDYKGGLTLFFQDGKFGGWELDGREHGTYTTALGIGIGSTLKDLQATGPVSVEESTIGHEFAAGDLSGLLSANAPDGKVTNLWAGVSCIFR